MADVSLLDEQGVLYAAPYSKARDDRLRLQLTQSSDALEGWGVVSGASVIAGVGLSVTIEDGLVLYYGGVLFTLTADRAVSLADDTLNTIWVRPYKTAASQSGDASRLLTATYDMTSPNGIVANTTDAEPTVASGTARWTRLAKVRTASGAVTYILNAVLVRNLRRMDPLRRGQTTIDAGEAAVIDAGESIVIPGPLTNNGQIANYGRLAIL